ncbi:hypothetical protein EELLY_v1c07800 [Entomoplasma ellychniae]|uniref:Type I restriction modification DNA specificity domain-containing protein n=1 Tax=Entomoplasma ellychniae TaxID=2114 RepID=A0A8E2QWR0_9MOLU|nr:hypothetical protein [Entomoplasma ellychniae]PPE05092.1 hypothetical protein EELLY_v1c07800 [Entomoplasma ellychniae]
MFLGKKVKIDEYSKVSLLNHLIIEDHKNKKAIFTRRILPDNLNDYFTLSDVCEERKIIENNEIIDTNQLNYIEISNIDNNKLVGNFKKNMKSSNFCKKGDLLISSVTPKSKKVWISDGNYKVSSAIIVLKFNDESVRDYIFDYLKNNVNNIFTNINSLSEGFKVTYSKISSWNLLNNIYFKKVKSN